MVVLGEAWVTIRIKDSDLKRGMLRSEQDTRRSVSNMQRDADSLGFANFAKFASNAIPAISAIGAAWAAVNIGREIIETGKTIQSLENAFKAITGSPAAAAAEMEFLRKETERLGQNTLSAAQGLKTIEAAAMGTALAGRGARDIFSAVSEAATVLGLKSEETQGALLAIGQMMSKGKVQAEELRGQLGERLPGAFQIAARAMGVTTAALDDMLKQGEVVAVDFLPKFAQALHEQYGGSVADAMNSATAASNRFDNAVMELKASLASSLLPTFTKVVQGLTEVINAFTDAEKKSKNLLTSVEDLATLGRIQIDVDFQYSGKTPDQLIKEWNIGGAGRGLGQVMTVLARDVKAWSEHLNDLTGEQARKGIDVSDQIREAARAANEAAEHERAAVYALGQTLDAATAAEQRYSVEAVVMSQRSADIAAAVKSAERSIKSSVPAVVELQKEIAALDTAFRFGKITEKDYAATHAALLDKLAKAGNSVKTRSMPVDFSAIDKQIKSAQTSIMDSFRMITDASYDMNIAMAEHSGNYYLAEEMRQRQWAEKAKLGFQQRVDSEAQAYLELSQKLARSKTGATPEVSAALDDLRKSVESLKAELPGYNALIDQAAANQLAWADESRKLSGAVDLAQVNLEYAELTNNVQGAAQAQLALIEATRAQKMANVNLDIPGLADAYKRLYDEQARIAKIMANGTAWQQFKLGMEDAIKSMETYRDVGRKAFDIVESGMADVFKGLLTGADDIQDRFAKMFEALADMLLEFAMKWMLMKALTSLGFSVGGMASGGYVSAGSTHIVGEKGPELFTSSRSGYIIPNHELTNGGTNRSGAVNHTTSIDVGGITIGDIGGGRLKNRLRGEIEDTVRRVIREELH